MIIKEQNIALRVDASSQIGTGHFMRCLTLADALKARGAHTRFLSRHLPDYLWNKLQEKGHEFKQLHDDAHCHTVKDGLEHSHWLGVSQPQDAAASIRALSDRNWDWLIIDHYALDVRWESLLRQSVSKILVIDDIADRHHYCDILLDQNLYVDMGARYASKVPNHCNLLLGPSYAMLRDEFGLLHQHVKPRSGPVIRVLVFLGGVDAANFTGQVIEALTLTEYANLKVDVVIGAQHPARKQIEADCKVHGYVCYVQTERMAELMAAADLAIGAGGSASWERCCLGLPSLLVGVADNQINIAKALDSYGACVYLGTCKTVNASIMRGAIASLLTNSILIERLSEKAYELVDGQGVGRVCKAMDY